MWGMTYCRKSGVELGLAVVGRVESIITEQLTEMFNDRKNKSRQRRRENGTKGGEWSMNMMARWRA